MAPERRTASIRWNESCNFVYQSRYKGKGLRTPEARRKFPKCGEIRDVNGDLWDVRDVRLTRHGFDLYFGRRPNDSTAGRCRLIATPALWNFWDTNCIKTNGILLDLPAGRTTLKRLRKRLGFNLHDDTDDFWGERLEDLEFLPAHVFAARHGVDKEVTFDRRRRLIGVRARAHGWWRDPKFVAVLLADTTLIQAGRKLGISIMQTKRLRDRAKQESRQEQPGL